MKCYFIYLLCTLSYFGAFAQEYQDRVQKSKREFLNDITDYSKNQQIAFMSDCISQPYRHLFFEKREPYLVKNTIVELTLIGLDTILNHFDKDYFAADTLPIFINLIPEVVDESDSCAVWSGMPASALKNIEHRRLFEQLLKDNNNRSEKRSFQRQMFTAYEKAYFVLHTLITSKYNNSEADKRLLFGLIEKNLTNKEEVALLKAEVEKNLGKKRE